MLGGVPLLILGGEAMLPSHFDHEVISVGFGCLLEKINPRFLVDLKASHCYSQLLSLPGTVPAQKSHFCGRLCLQLCWEQDQGFPSSRRYTASSTQAAAKQCSEQRGARGWP